MFKNIKSKIQENREKKKLEREEEIKRKKEQIINNLTRKWSLEEVRQRNADLITISAGWLGGTYTEFDFKQSILSKNYMYFTDEEYNELYKMIKQQKEERERKINDVLDILSNEFNKGLEKLAKQNVKISTKELIKRLTNKLERKEKNISNNPTTPVKESKGKELEKTLKL
jgi:hypothetical protein